MLLKKIDLNSLESTKLSNDLRDLVNLPNNTLPLISRLQSLTLLTPGAVNAKTAKQVTGHEILNFILHLSPANLSGVNICPMASKGCKAACLNTAGRGRFDSIQLARLRKTLYYLKFKSLFIDHLIKECAKIERKAAKLGQLPVVRLNGTSDIPWESFKLGDKNIFELFPNIQFYDYTKIVSRLDRCKSIPNYHLTFSASESNEKHCLQALALGYNVAAVFRHDLPATYLNRPVINGDSHDFRFLDTKDAQGLIIGLKAKGKAKKDASGFVRD